MRLETQKNSLRKIELSAKYNLYVERELENAEFSNYLDETLLSGYRTYADNIFKKGTMSDITAQIFYFIVSVILFCKYHSIDC